jgi:Fe2+ transport system protein FeoA
MLNLSRNQLRKMKGLLTGHYHLKGHLFKMGLVNSTECNIYKQSTSQNSLIHSLRM